MPEALQSLIDALPREVAERVRIVGTTNPNDAPDGAFVVHWMHNAVRVDDNPALNASVQLANALGVPALVYHAVSERYPFASDRHHTFMLEGARDVAGQMQRAGLPYAFHLERPDDDRPHLKMLAKRAAVVVTDDMPTEPTRSWLDALARAVDTPILAVDASCIVPMPLVRKAHDRAFAFRKATSKIRKERLHSEWVCPMPDHAFDPADAVAFDPLPIGEASDRQLADWIGECRIDHSVGPVPHTRGGTAAGRERWRTFAGGRLSRYSRDRNDALKPGVSKMSPYLHYGYVGPFELTREAHDAGGGGAEKYLDELLVWRELAYAFCRHRRDHDTLDALPEWARQSLAEHVRDRRPHDYDWETLARGATSSEFWNAAQHSLLVHGELHNNVRMTWAKALLEWTDGPERCLEMLIDLNNRYALDGRDPASYGGLLWCLGQFDRPFPPEKPITGLVRGRSVSSHAKRLPPEDYARLTRRPLADELPRVGIVGGGLSGLLAARILRDHGIEVEVFDKGRRPGGRGCSRERDDCLFDYALSSILVHDKTEPILQTYLDAWEHRGLMQRWQPEVAVITGPQNAVERREDFGRYRLCFRPKAEALGRHLLDSTLPPVSADQADRTLIRSGTLVTAIDDGPDGRMFTTDEGETFGPFDEVILAVPPENVDRIVPGDEPLSGGIRQRPVWTVMLTLADPIAAPGENIAYREHPMLCKAVNEASKPGRSSVPCWTVHASVEFTEANVDREPDEVAPEIVAAFLKSVAAESATVESAIAHRWRYGLRPANDRETLRPILRAARNRGYLLAGDWTDWTGDVSKGVPGWYGSENAFMSGLRAAGEVLRGVQVAATRDATRPEPAAV